MQQAPRKASAAEVPVLDMSQWLAGGSPDQLVKELYSACIGTGFFYIKGHGMPTPVIDNAFAAAQRYFALPEAERLKDKIDEKFRRGYMPYGVNQHPGYAPDMKHSFDFGTDLPLTDPDVAAGLPLHGPNKWPADKPWLREAAQAYFEHTSTIGHQLLKIFALALEQDEHFFLQWTQKPMMQSRLFHYPAQDLAGEISHGVAPHTDYGMITILAQDPIGGLELLLKTGEWIAAPYIEDTLVVNLGDLFKVWTNDKFVSNQHRVFNRTGKERYSIPTFFNLDYRTPVACLPHCVSADCPAKYEPILAGDYLVSRFRDVQKFKVGS